VPFKDETKLEALGDARTRGEAKRCTCKEDALLREMRQRTLMQMGADFRMDYEAEFLSREGYAVLEEATAQAMDRNDMEELWSTIECYHHAPCWASCLRKCWPWLGATLLMNQCSTAIELNLSFMHACDVFNTVTRDFFADPDKIPLIDQLQAEVETYRRKAQKHMKRIMEGYPTVWGGIQTKKSLLVLHAKQEETINELWKKGLLMDREHAALSAVVHSSLLKTENKPANLLHVSPTWQQDALEGLPFWKLLAPKLQARLSEAKILEFQRGDKVYESKEMKQAAGALIIANGVVDISGVGSEEDRVVDSLTISECIGLWEACHVCGTNATARHKHGRPDDHKHKSRCSSGGNSGSSSNVLSSWEGQRLGVAIVRSKAMSAFFVPVELCREMLGSGAGDVIWQLAGVSVLRVLHFHEHHWLPIAPKRIDLKALCLAGEIVRVGTTEKKVAKSPILLLRGSARIPRLGPHAVIKEASLLGVPSTRVPGHPGSLSRISEKLRAMQQQKPTGTADDGLYFTFAPGSVYLRMPWFLRALELIHRRNERESCMKGAPTAAGKYVPGGMTHTDDALDHNRAAYASLVEPPPPSLQVSEVERAGYGSDCDAAGDEKSRSPPAAAAAAQGCLLHMHVQAPAVPMSVFSAADLKGAVGDDGSGLPPAAEGAQAKEK